LRAVISPFFMTLQEQFDAAVAQSKELTKRPSNEELLKIYALFKQATEGDVSGERPGGFDFKAIAKFDAWTELKGKTTDQAKQEYVDFMTTLVDQYK
jgi:diazepam-binding inhibitor (GABA receptor modulator, acyl-CoA-binding protein)